MKYACLFLVLLLPLSVHATSWLVMQDGSGDYTDIQTAVDGCAVGDTVLVGPGRYDTFGVHWPELNWTEVAAATVDSLTIKALFRNTAIIGPSSSKRFSDKDSEKAAYPFGIASGIGNTWLVIEDMVVENVSCGIGLYPSGVVRNCIIRNIHDSGIRVFKGYNALIENCVTYNTGQGYDLEMYENDGTSAEVIVRDCKSYDDEVGFSNTHPLGNIENCYAYRSRVGFDIQSGIATMDHCGATGCYFGVSVMGLGQLSMNNCVIQGSDYRDLKLSSAYLYGSNNTFYGGGSAETIYIANGSAVFQGNRISPSSGYTINMPYHNSPGVELDFSNNYWETSDPDSVAAWIWDGVDNPSLGITVDYLPLQPREAWAGVGEDTTPSKPVSLDVFPNPFNPSTTIRFNLNEPQQTKVAVYDVSGRLIKTLLDEFTHPGEQTIEWNGRDGSGRAVSSGSYFVRLQGDRVSEVRKVMLVR